MVENLISIESVVQSKPAGVTRSIAVERVIRFGEMFGKDHLHLAMHASLPAIITPDLLYRIWARFVPTAPWIAVADILLSQLCKEVGYELYEMDKSVRDILIDELKFEFGGQQVKNLANFLILYLQNQKHGENWDDEELNRFQYWTALAYVDSKKAKEFIVKAFSDALSDYNREPSRIDNVDALLAIRNFLDSVPLELQAQDLYKDYTNSKLRVNQGNFEKPYPQYELLNYLANNKEIETLPSLTELSKELGVSVASLREQLEIARTLGFVEIRARTGVRKLKYTFTPTVRASLQYAIALHDENFKSFAELKGTLDASYWHEAVKKLTEEDKVELKAIVVRAWAKLRGTPVQVPHEEQRKFNLLIYSRLENPFVEGILEAYWDAYESVGLNIFAGSFEYLQNLWENYQKMLDAILSGEYSEGYAALVASTDLLYIRR